MTTPPSTEPATSAEGQAVSFKDSASMISTLDGLLNESISVRRNLLTDGDITILREAAKRTLSNLFID